MNRRKAMIITAGLFAGGGIGAFTLANAFKPKEKPVPDPSKLDYKLSENGWEYELLDPDHSAQLAYSHYSEGSCMYATIKSIVMQLAEKIGEPYKSLPLQIFKYGHGGIGGYGSVCGTLNGAAALTGMVITEKEVRDKIIGDIFQWYEKETFPKFSPDNPIYDYTPAKSVSNSVLCHASNTNWCNKAGFGIKSNERKERCRRLSADVAKKTTSTLNDIFTNNYITGKHYDKTVNSCMTCHGGEGKVKNVSSKMSCKSCHSESLGHKVFSDIHYKMMNE